MSFHPKQIREMFATILVFNEVGDPVALWDEFKEKMAEDFLHQARRLNSERAFDEGIFKEALRVIQRYLQADHKDLAAFGLPTPAPRPTEHFVQEEIARHPFAAQAVNRDRDAPLLNPAQHLAFVTVVAATEMPVPPSGAVFFF